MKHQVPDRVAVGKWVAPELLLGKRVHPIVELRGAMTIFTGEGGCDRFGKCAQDFFSRNQCAAPALSLRNIAPSFITKKTFSTWRIFCVGPQGPQRCPRVCRPPACRFYRQAPEVPRLRMCPLSERPRVSCPGPPSGETPRRFGRVDRRPRLCPGRFLHL